jgi:serine/threonine-protein kinase HipA
MLNASYDGVNLSSNTDDHLRNHAFLYEGQGGWRLSPAYDLNPVPEEIKPRVLQTTVDLDDATVSLELAFSVASEFRLTQKEAKLIASKVAEATSQWRKVAASLEIKSTQINRMASAFEHEDLLLALQ